MAISFKSDDSFLRKLAVGAAGTNATIARLREMGFNPIELERGSTGFKIWKKIKIKRVRVPDILCLKTGLRFESRGKTKTEISMSHSLKDPKRAWDAGMRSDDFVSIVVFEQDVDSLVELKQLSPVHFIYVEDMQNAFANEQVTITKPKGVEEGSEIRVLWTCAQANQKSVVTSVDDDKIKLTPVSDEKQQTVRLHRRRKQQHITLVPQVKKGDVVNVAQIVASVVPVYTELVQPPLVDESYYLDRMKNVNLSERYAAAKALRYRGYDTAGSALSERMLDPYEDIYVQLEAAAALAAYGDPGGWEFVESKLQRSVFEAPLETQLETVIVISEIPSEQSEHLLIEVLRDVERNDEIRAGAAWALGQFASTASATALADTFNSSPLEIKIEAARALLRIAEPQVEHLVELLADGDLATRDGIAWALARTGKFSPADIIVGADDNLRRWISYILGYGKDNFAEAEVESICNADPEVYFAASVLWQILASWVNDLREF